MCVLLKALKKRRGSGFLFSHIERLEPCSLFLSLLWQCYAPSPMALRYSYSPFLGKMYITRVSKLTRVNKKVVWKLRSR